MSRNNGRTALLSAQRLAHIREVLQDQGAATIQHLSDRVGASFSTIRRDLDLLVQQGIVSRTHGGATLRAGPPQEAWAIPAQGYQNKVAIGTSAADEIEDGQTVIFDSGLTVLQAARRVVERGLHITAVTNSIKTAAELARSEGVKLVVVGGTLRPGTFTLVGEPGLSLLERMRVDVALLNTQAVDEGRMAHNDMEVAAMACRMMAAARRRVLLVDSWKFERSAFYQICPLTDFDLVISDEGLSAEGRAAAQRAGTVMRLVSASDTTASAGAGGN
jgi:DeoR family transcriptional regulator of aga operon